MFCCVFGLWPRQVFQNFEMVVMFKILFTAYLEKGKRGFFC